MRRHRPGLGWFLVVVAACAIAACVIIGMMQKVHGAERCAAPDPAAKPVVKLASGELRALAALAWGEARGDGYCSMQAVAAVVVNRMRSNPKEFGATVTQVINRPYAFSVFGKRDPNRAKVAKVGEEDPVFLTAMLAAIAAVGGADPVGGADHFHTSRTLPAWAARMPVTARIGGHVYRRSP